MKVRARASISTVPGNPREDDLVPKKEVLLFVADRDGGHTHTIRQVFKLTIIDSEG